MSLRPLPTTHNLRASRRVLLAASALTVPLLGGCGSDEPSAVDGPIEISAIDYSYVGVPERAKVGATLAMKNDSTKEVHEIVAVRLPDDEERSVADLVKLPEPELEPLFAGLETVVIAPPGADGFAVEGTGALTRPGRYALVCFIPTGVDPEVYMAAAAQAQGGPPDVEGGPPHVVEGMFAEITVVD